MWQRVLKRTVIAVGSIFRPLFSRLGIDLKARYELNYWRRQARREGQLSNLFYRRLFTDVIGLTEESYQGERVLDIGCGPRGSLEWMTNSSMRIGIDPLLPDYAQFGIAQHSMLYTAAAAEHLPFRSQSFDIVTSLNSLDHVDDLEASLSEIRRVLRMGGIFVLLVEVHRYPTLAEPISIPWDLTRTLRTEFEVVREQHFEESPKRRGSSAAASAGVLFDHSDDRVRVGTLLAVLRRTQQSGSTPRRLPGQE